ncbi:MAG: sulfurtransferase, partial [Pseudomonadales bacterium]
MYQTIIDSWEVAQLCDSGAKVVILDCRFNLMDVEQGRTLFLQGALPKAQYVDLNRQLSSEVRPDSGRHPLPSRESALALFSALGIDSSVQVVVYDDCSGAMAARAWWLLQWLGHRACAVLDGGIQAWQGDGFELVPGSTAEVTVASFSAAPSAFVALSTEDILSERYQLVDARAAARFQGEQEPIDPVAGHVPGAQNWPFQQNLDGDGRL